MAGRSYEGIAGDLGRHPSTVSYWARRHGLTSTHVSAHAARGGIARDVLVQLVEEGLTVRGIASRLDRSGATVRHWLRVYELQTRRTRSPAPSEATRGTATDRVCPHHGWTRFVRRGNTEAWRCLQCRAEGVTRRRRKVKDILVREGGGRCSLCGYDRYLGALGFHHLDPAEKRFGISEMGASRSLSRARAEARKCVLLCANCHAEVEGGVTRLSLGSSAAHPEPIRVVQDEAYGPG